MEHVEFVHFCEAAFNEQLLDDGQPKSFQEVQAHPNQDEWWSTMCIDSVCQSEYRLGVGMLLYLLKHSRPKISNAIRELSKVLDGATEAH